MKYLSILLFFIPFIVFGQNVGIGTPSPHASAKLEVQSTTGGVLIPRLTTQERNDVPTPIATGLLIYNSENTRFEFWNGTAWGPIASATTGGSSLSDADDDTKLEVELSPDEDTIRMSVKNHEILKIDSKTLHISAENRGTLIGLNAGKNLPLSDSWNTILGYRSGEETNSGVTNTMVGAYAGSKGNKGSSNTFLGGLSGQENTGDNNTFLGIQAGQSTGNSSDNTYIGVNAGAQNTGSQNISIGHFSSYLGSGNNNIGIGRYSLFSPGNNVSGLVAIGDSTLHRSGQLSTFPFQGINNTAVGTKALKKNTQGLNNTAVGNNSLEHNTSGANNTSLGSSAGNSNTNGIGNTSIGSLSLLSNTTGDFNVSIGYEAGRFSGGNRNTFIGYASGASNFIGSGNTFIGHRAGENETGDDKLYIHNSPSSTPLIYGDFQENKVLINESLEVQNNSTIGRAISGYANNTGPFTNYGGYFESKGQSGTGVFGLANSSSSINYGGYFQSNSVNGRGVYGVANGIGSVTNFGGYFRSFGGNGFGTYSIATAGNGIGLYAEGAVTAALLKGETEIRAKSNDAILSMKSVTDLGVNRSRVIIRQDNGEDVYLGDVDPNGGNVFIRADGIDVIKADGMGRVGIGTNSADKTLHIKGDVKIESNGSSFPSFYAETADGTSSRWMMMDNNTKDIYLGALDSNSDDLVLRSNGQNRMYIKDNGNIGIGTSAPSEEFHVKGEFNLESNTAGGDELMYVTSTAGLKSNILYYNELFDEIHLGDIDQNLDAFVLESGGFNTITLENGNVGLNMYPNHQLDLSTGEAYKPGGGSWKTPSDRRLKKNIIPFTDGLTTLLKMKPVSYHYNQQSGYDPSVEYIGMIAQDLQRVAPYMVKRENTGLLSIDPTALTYILINTVKEQQEIIGELRRKDMESEQKFQELESTLNKLIKKVDSVKSIRAKK